MDLGWRLIFAEHTDREGTKFDAAAMKRIAARCNERISESGDFSPVSVRHNRKDSDSEVVGFMGPFKTAMTGKKHRKMGVYGKFRVFKEDYAKVRKHPRISVEYWGDRNDHTNGFFDPISLLGSETPELDLGIHYSKDAGDRVCVKYSRLMHYQAAPVAAGGTNTSVPTTDLKKKTTYEAQTTMLTPEDLQSIVAALKPVVQAIVAEMNPAPQVDEEMPMDGDTALPGDELAPELPGDDAAPVEDAADAPPGADAAPAVAEDKPAAPPVDAKADEPDDKDDEPAVKKYQRERDEISVKYAKVVQERDELAALVEDSKRDARRAVRYQKLAELQGQGYLIEPKEEIADVEDLDDAGFVKFTATVVKKYQRIPVDMIPVARAVDTDGDGKRLAKYQKEAFELCEAETKAGRYLPYSEAIDRVKKNYEKQAA